VHLPPALRSTCDHLDLVVLNGDGVAASLFAGELLRAMGTQLPGAWEHTTALTPQRGLGGGAGLERRVLHQIVGLLGGNVGVSVTIDHADKHSAAQDVPTRWPSALPKGALVLPLALMVRDSAARLNAKVSLLPLLPCAPATDSPPHPLTHCAGHPVHRVTLRTTARLHSRACKCVRQP